MAGAQMSVTAEQRRVLQAVYDDFCLSGEWPLFDRVDRQLYRAGAIDVIAMVHSMPDTLLRTGTPRGVAPRPSDKVWLTLAGIAVCDGSDGDVQLFLRALRWMSRYERDHDPEPGETSLAVSHRRLARALKVPLRDVDRLRRLFQILHDEDWGGVGSSHNEDGTEWKVRIGRNVRHFSKVRTVEDYLEAKTRRLGQPAASGHRAADEMHTDAGEVTAIPAKSYVESRIIGLIEERRRGRWDCTKLLGLLRELDDNYRRGNGYAAHALLRAVLDHVPPLFAQPSFSGVVNNHPWSRTDRRYVKQLAFFRDQADDVLHRQISHSPDLLTVEDMPSRAAVNNFLRECTNQLRPGT